MNTNEWFFITMLTIFLVFALLRLYRFIKTIRADDFHKINPGSHTKKNAKKRWLTGVVTSPMIIPFLFACALSGCVLATKKLIATDQKTGMSVTLTEEQVSIDPGETIQVGDIKIEAESYDGGDSKSPGD